MLLPPELREFAGLERHAMLIGQGNRCRAVGRDALDRAARFLAEERSRPATDLPAELDSLSL